VNVAEVVKYWLESAEDDWPVTSHLFASGDYHYALFFGHLYLEKLLKGLVVQVTGQHAPRSHNLIYLSERADLTISVNQRKILVRVTNYNLETRYPEERAILRKRYTKDFTEAELKVIEETGRWLKSGLKQKKM